MLEREDIVLVPVKGSKVSDMAIRLADISYPEANIVPVHVIVVDKKLPLDSELQQEAQHGESVLSKAERTLAGGFHRHAMGELIQTRDLGNAIVDEGIERKAKAIVMGFKLKESSDVGMSTATRRVLGGFLNGEVVLYRPAKPESVQTGSPRPKVIRLERHNKQTEEQSHHKGLLGFIKH